MTAVAPLKARGYRGFLNRVLYYTSGQWMVFLAMIPAGFLAGVWYGVISLARRIMRSGPVLNCVCDILAALGIWLIVMAGLIAACFGDMRLYAFAGAGIGFALERVTLGLVPGGLKRVFKKLWSISPFRQEKRRHASK
ncbi:MAG: spore cortex biosynthesis protein YabQ [Clostridia bacterium]|nr:spore cortex biosynthesis protein YabQ [Clostridia bacterium]